MAVGTFLPRSSHSMSIILFHPEIWTPPNMHRQPSLQVAGDPLEPPALYSTSHTCTITPMEVYCSSQYAAYGWCQETRDIPQILPVEKWLTPHSRRIPQCAGPRTKLYSSPHFACQLPLNLVVARCLQLPFLPICSKLEMGSGVQRDHVRTMHPPSNNECWVR